MQSDTDPARMSAQAKPQPERGETALQPQDLAVTIFGAHVRRPGQRVWSGGMVEILGEFGFSTEAARAALSRLVTRGLLERQREGRLVYYVLSAARTRAARRGRPADLQLRPRGAGGERVDRGLAHDPGGPARGARTARTAPAVPRVRLRAGRHVDRRERPRAGGSRAAARTGRRRPCVDVPGPHRARARSRRCCCRARGTSATWSAATARSSSEYGVYLDAARRDRLDPRAAFTMRTRMLHTFRSFPSADPELPEGIAPGAAARAEAVATFDAIYEALAEPATAHFGEVALARPARPSASPAPVVVRPRCRRRARAAARRRWPPATARPAP